jgi:hypothetical protein
VERAPDERSKLSSSKKLMRLLLRLLQLLLIATAAAFAPIAPQGRCSVQLTSYKELHAVNAAAAESIVEDVPVKKHGSVIAAAALVAGTTIGGTAQHSYFLQVLKVSTSKSLCAAIRSLQGASWGCLSTRRH